MTRINFIWISLLICTCMPAICQVDFTCRVDTNRMLIGDQRLLTLEVSSPAEISADTVDFAAWKEAGVELLESQRWQRNQTGTLLQQLRIAVFDTGYLQLPPLKLIYQQEGETRTIQSNNLSLEVSGIMIDSTGLAPIKPILKEPLMFRDFIPYILALLAGAAIIALVFLRHKKEAPEEVIVEIPIPPHEKALTALLKLRDQKLWQQGKIKEYQSNLTHIIREYLEDRFQIRALESTTSEILADLKDQSLLGELRNQLDEILNMADLIKFAKAEPSVDIHERFMQQAEDFVRQTKIENEADTEEP